MRRVPARRGCGRRFAESESGIATLEFVLIVPILIAMVYGVAEYVNVADHRDKVSALARTLADLTSQNSTGQATDEEMKLNRGSAGPILAPFDANQAIIQISSVGVNANNANYICSTWALDPKKEITRIVGKDKSLVVPDNFKRAGARYVLAEVKMTYQPLFGSVLRRLLPTFKLDFNWSESVAWPVRGGKSLGTGQDAEIVMPGGKACDPKAT
ncbi:TadE/TadG family type IV pilus assembly protein [Methylorubrum sp. SB2]|uniref:TadE/TadG family type IV pilus assembly protein n=1 Tax=Methylorubrum subtropicum TaxID=3138812 RepID=UPI00313E67DA